MFTIPAPKTPVNPAERPIAAAVLQSALISLHPIENFNAVFATLSSTHPVLEEEIHEQLVLEQDRRLADKTKVIQFIPNHLTSCDEPTLPPTRSSAS